MGDDDYITFRSVENFIHGNGPTFNIDERLQNFTQPLWFFLLSGLNAVTQRIGALNPWGQMYFIVHVVDKYALADPLMPRLRLINTQNWRIGHFKHVIPAGYLDTLQTGANQIKDPGLAIYYDKLRLVTRGGLWDRQRWVEIFKLNVGQYDHLTEAFNNAYQSSKNFRFGQVGLAGFTGQNKREAGKTCKSSDRF